MRRAAIPSAILTVSLACGAFVAPSASAAQKPSGSLSDITALGLSGASPHADERPDGSVLLYYPSPEAGGTAIASCSMAGACTVVGSIPRIADLTDVVLADGTRIYYAKAPNALGDREYTLERATLTMGASDATSDTKKKKKKKR